MANEFTAAVIQQVLSTAATHRRIAAESIIAGRALLYLISLATHQLITAQLHPRNSFAMTCAFIASFVALHAGAVGWLLATTPRELNSWINLLNVPFTCGLMVSGGLVGARRAMRPA